MKLSFNWLLELVHFCGSVVDLEDLLARAGVQVKSISGWGESLKDIVAAQILEKRPHPQLSHLTVYQVLDGLQLRQVLCDTKKCYCVGDKVPLAPPGVTLPGNVRVCEDKLHGITSQGMFCDAGELALVPGVTGKPFILPEGTIIGTKISEIFPPDSILDLDITPNRGDWLSHLGIAREVAAFTGASLKWSATLPTTVTKTRSNSLVAAEVRNIVGCEFYSLRRIQGIRVAASPLWLRAKLESVGVCSVNNIVDITNYVTLLMGQPLYAFDAAQVCGDILVRLAHEGERFLDLGGQEYSLTSGDMVIADEKGPIALAGIVGGGGFGISTNTTEILLESAAFHPGKIRRTSCRTGLSSNYSYRFERGVDTTAIVPASELAKEWICKIAGGRVKTPMVVDGAPLAATRVTIHHGRAARLLGMDLNPTKISRSLERGWFTLLDLSQESSSWKVPDFRRDLTREVDLIGEVMRLIGIEAINEARFAEPSPSTQEDAVLDFYSTLHQRLVAQGFFEVRTHTLVSDSLFHNLISESEAIRLRNPHGEDQALLRPGLVPALLPAVQKNLSHGQQTVRLYEIGKVFRRGAKEGASSLGIAMAGVSTSPSWRGRKSRLLDLYDLKGIVQSLTRERLRFVLSTTAISTQIPATPLSLEENLCLYVLEESGETIGVVGQLLPYWSRKLGIPEGILVAELWLEPLQKGFATVRKISAIPRYPAIVRDLAILLPKKFSYESVLETLLSAGEPFLCSVMPFDVFVDPTGIKLPIHWRSIGVSLVFRSEERTLTKQEAVISEKRLKQRLASRLGARFRSSP
ncbi:MAG: phenylalanine--tRNA ligase subunit beta [Candidatus Xiphinematobacter sp.]|nr:MAG: phenylalanine--tRNA ligase subunit beta [Candidatus Xiphinematobacter sp.]